LQTLDDLQTIDSISPKLTFKHEWLGTTELKEKVCKKADSLPEEIKEILLLRKHYQLTQSEIACKLNLRQKQIEDCITYVIQHLIQVAD